MSKEQKKEISTDLTATLTENILTKTIYSAVEKLIPNIIIDIDKEVQAFVKSDQYISIIRSCITEIMSEKIDNYISSIDLEGRLKGVVINSSQIEDTLRTILIELLQKQENQTIIKRVIKERFINNLENYCIIDTMMNKLMKKHPMRIILDTEGTK